MASDAMLPCPFCGSSDIRITDHGNTGTGMLHRGERVYTLGCYACGATCLNGGMYEDHGRAKLIEKWNRRTPAPEVAGSSDSSMPVVAWCDLSNPLNNEAFAWPGTLRPATHTCALYTAPPPTAEVEDAITSYLEARDALDNREYAGINGEPWDVLQRRVHAARKDLDAALQSEAQTGKPGGSHEAMAELNQAREQGLKARGG